MKKIFPIFVIFILLVTISVSSTPVLIEKRPIISGTGSFSGKFWYSDTEYEIGEFNGSYIGINMFYIFLIKFLLTDGFFEGLEATLIGFINGHIILGNFRYWDHPNIVIGYVNIDKNTQTFEGKLYIRGLSFGGTFQ